MTEGAKLPLSCEVEGCWRPGPILGVTLQGMLRLCGEHFLGKVESGQVEGTVRGRHTLCTLCPATLCTDFGNGYMSMRDYEADTADYQAGTIYDCQILQASVHNPQEGMYVDDNGRISFEMRSVKDLEQGL